MMKIFLYVFGCFLLMNTTCFAQSIQVDTFKKLQLPEVNLLGKKEGILNHLPGSIHSISKIQMQNMVPISGNEVLRKVTGIHVVDEEGAGLRTNIGIRGLDPDRSRSVLVLEDGVPVALNPYGEPELYYSPVIDRMSGVEIVKGSGQLLYGPQTIGGVINYKTANPPEKTTTRLKIIAGERNFLSALIGVGTTKQNVGIQTNYLRKQANQLGYSKFAIDDLSTKLKIELSEKSRLGIKLGFYNEVSNATYIGLTQPMYEQGDDDFVLMAPNDELTIRRYSASVTHDYAISPRLNLQTTAYAYSTTRNWRRQDFSTTPLTSGGTGVIWGDTSIVGGAVYMKNSNAGRNRQFEVIAVEPKLTYTFKIKNMNSELKAGTRFLVERAFEQRINGRTELATAGDIVEDEERNGKALSAYVQNQLNVSKKVIVTAGIRVEQYNYGRNILRNSFLINNATLIRDTNILSTNSIASLLPGIGINYNPTKYNTIFAGIHRGFAPPRVKDAITKVGEVYNLEAEKSWNMELGARGQLFENVLHYEATVFYMDFENQVIPVAESAGGTGSGLVNGGETFHKGFELGFRYHLGKHLRSKYSIDVNANATWIDARFAGNRFMMQGNEQVNIRNNRTPYAPQRTLNYGLFIESPYGFSTQVNMLMVSKQFTDGLNTIKPTADGRIGEMPAYHILDMACFYKLKKSATRFSVQVKNVTNERYIASRRPQGIRVGVPRFITAGVDITF